MTHAGAHDPQDVRPDRADRAGELLRGFTNYWDGYFAGRSAPLGRVPAEVVDAAFYNFGPGEAARHIVSVWDTTTPEEAHAARQHGCVAAAMTDTLAEAPCAVLTPAELDELVVALEPIRECLSASGPQ